MDSFISWIGGKKALRKKILEQFPESGTYDRYIEVFGGAGWVLFAEEQHSPIEVYNDINGELVNLFRVVKYHPEALQKELEWLLNSRAIFTGELNKSLSGMTDIQRAARFYTLVRESFGTDCHSFCCKGYNLNKHIEYMAKISKRLNSVVIENVDFERLIKIYDRPRALFYLDPPYYNAEKCYVDRFSESDHERLCKLIRQIKGKFILSYNDCAKIRNMYEGYNIVPVERYENLTSKTTNSNYKELIIKNF